MSSFADKKWIDDEYDASKLGVADATVSDLAKAAAWTLTDKKLMDDALIELNSAMFAKYLSNATKNLESALTTQDLKKHISGAVPRDEDDSTRHLLDAVLGEFETKQQFATMQAPNGHPRVIVMTGTLTGNDFLKTVEEGHMAKDYVTLAHGIYTHRIQWYCLAKASDTFQKESLSAAFKRFQTGEAWLHTFDRLPKHAQIREKFINNFDFRTPEKLHDYLRSADTAGNMPYLNAYMASKHKDVEKISWLVVKKYVAARKLFPNFKTASDGWKKWPRDKKGGKTWSPKDYDEFLQNNLSPSDMNTVKTFLTTGDGHNILTPTTGGGYQMGFAKNG